jgi:ligand-binding sensor domain-containing protein
VRGASALQSALQSAGEVRAWVVWEPVLATDLGPPSAATASLVRDARATQLWDAHRALSGELLRMPWIEDEEGIVWDYVAVFPPGTHWGDKPSFAGAPVVQVAESLQAALRGP